MLDFDTAETLTELPRVPSPNPAYSLERMLLRESEGNWAVIAKVAKTTRDYRRVVFNEAQRLRATHFPKASGYTVRQDSLSDVYFAYVLVRFDSDLTVA